MTYKWDDTVASIYETTLNNNLFFLSQKNRFIPKGTDFVRKGTPLFLRNPRPESIVKDHLAIFNIRTLIAYYRTNLHLVFNTFANF